MVRANPSTRTRRIRPPRRLARRLFGSTAGRAALALLALAQIVVLGCQGGGAAEGAVGRIAWPKDGDLWVYDVTTRQSTKLTNLPRGAAVTGVTWSGDGRRLVYSQFWRRPNENASGADLFIANADGSDPQVFAERDAPNSVLDSPDWAPGGRVYYTARRIQGGRESQTIVRQAEGGPPEPIVENAYSPGVTPDESAVPYIRPTRVGMAMFKKTMGQAGDGCELLSDQVFQILGVPRVSPDGKQVALGGSGDPFVPPGPNGCGGDPTPPRKASSPAPLLDLVAWLDI